MYTEKNPGRHTNLAQGFHKETEKTKKEDFIFWYCLKYLLQRSICVCSMAGDS